MIQLIAIAIANKNGAVINILRFHRVYIVLDVHPQMIKLIIQLQFGLMCSSLPLSEKMNETSWGVKVHVIS